jgi:hypothetical protein
MPEPASRTRSRAVGASRRASSAVVVDRGEIVRRQMIDVLTDFRKRRKDGLAEVRARVMRLDVSADCVHFCDLRIKRGAG